MSTMAIIGLLIFGILVFALLNLIMETKIGERAVAGCVASATVVCVARFIYEIGYFYFNNEWP